MTETIPTADVIAVAPADGELQVLLVLRGWDPYEGYWALPGGHVDDGEHPKDAAARELAEETGVTVDADTLRLIGTYAEPGRDPRGRYSSDAYVIELDHAPAPAADDDAAEAVWFPLNRVLRDDFPLAFDHSRIVADAAAHLTEQENAMKTYRDKDGNVVSEKTDRHGNVVSRTVSDKHGNVTSVNNGGTVGIQSAGSVNNRVIRR